MQTIETRTQCADIKLRARARTRNGWARTPWTARPGLARTFAHACAEAGHDACSSGDASRACTSVCGVGSHQKATGEEHARRRSSCCASRQQGAASSVEEETNASSIVGDVLCRVPAIIILPSYALYPRRETFDSACTKGPKARGSRLPGLTRQGGKHTLQRPKTKGQCARRRAGPRHGDHPGPGRPPFWRTVVGRPCKGLYRGALKINTRHTPRAERERERDQERERALLLY